MTVEYRSRNTPDEPWQPWAPIPPKGYVPIVKFSLLYPQLWQVRKV